MVFGFNNQGIPGQARNDVAGGVIVGFTQKDTEKGDNLSVSFCVFRG